ncbi:hypothetical protein K501DRAFT_60452 [Backusella circina FSU 941]|nr:hypothetical protein K501DRAFT_60452 [Backusella circina FSU 941]
MTFFLFFSLLPNLLFSPLLGDLRRAHLLRHLTHSWATQYTTTLITMVLSSAPYTTTSSYQRERFLRAFTKEWDFSKLSEFFMYLQSPANIDYKVKCVMLQEAARRERETLGAKLKKKRGSDRKEDTDSFQTDGSVSSTVAPIGSTGVSVSNTDNSASSSSTCTVSASNTNVTSASCFITDTPTLSSNSALSSTITGPGSASNTTSSSSSSSAVAATTAVVVVSAAAGPNNSEISTRRHHRRTSSNDVNDIKRLRLSTPDLDHSDNQDTASVVNYTTSSGSTLNAPNGGNAGTTTRRSASPDHHSHSHSSLHHLRCVTCTPPASTSTAANGNGTTATTSSNTPLFTAGSATSHSGK